LFPSSDKRLSEIISRVSKQGLSYLDEASLSELSAAIIEIEKQQIPGIIVEAGCALGGSGIVIAATKSKERRFSVFDVFGMIPPPSRFDGSDVLERYQIIRSGRSKGINGEMYYGYQDDLYEKVNKNFKDFGLDIIKHNIQFVRGLYEHTLQINSSVAFAHIDCDWYQSVMVCLTRIEPFLVKNGVLVIDDYYAWSGCRSAVDEYFFDKKERFLFEKKNRLHIKRIT